MINMQHWFSHLQTWLYQVWQPIDAMKSGTNEEIIWGLLMILGFLGSAVGVILMFSRRKSQEIMGERARAAREEGSPIPLTEEQ